MTELAKGEQSEKLGTFGQIKDLLINGKLLETHLPGYQYLGPGTRLFERLGSPDIKSVPINSLDALALEHDLAYSTGDRDHMRKADDLMIEKMKLQQKSLLELLYPLLYRLALQSISL